MAAITWPEMESEMVSITWPQMVSLAWPEMEQEMAAVTWLEMEQEMVPITWPEMEFASNSGSISGHAFDTISGSNSMATDGTRVGDKYMAYDSYDKRPEI